ncbi:MAG: glycosyltransferase, partial [Pseudomonadota bacterium]
ADQRLAPGPAPEFWPSVVAIIPARNERPTIGDVVASLKSTHYPGRLDIVVVDDHSDDGTADAAKTAGATVIAAEPLPQGWSGKLWAVHAGLEHANQACSPAPEWILLTDADIHHAPDTLRKLVAKGHDQNLALVSLMARLDSRGIWGGLLIPAFVFFFQKLYPFPWVNRHGHWMAAAAGGCMLIRRTALQEIGGIAVLKDALIDDCTLGAKLKHGPPKRRIWLGLSGSEVTSLRDNRSLKSIWTMVSRTAFTQLRHSTVLLIGAVVGMVFIYIAPWIALVWGASCQDLLLAVSGGCAIIAMSVAYWPTLQLYDQPIARTLLLPVAAAIYTAMTVTSAIHHWRGQGGKWKGRTYP